MSEWIGVIEASRILGIAPNTVKKLVRQGVLPAYEITGVRGYQFKREDVEGLIRPVTPESKPTVARKSRSTKKK